MARPAAVIVTYNSEDVIAGCLDALAKFAPEIKVMVVDNASTDHTMAIVRSAGVDYAANTRNYGFASAANTGVLHPRDASMVLLMNPDVRLQTSIGPLADATGRYGVAGGRLVGEDGCAQAGFTIRRFPTVTVLALELLGINRLWPSNPWNRRYRYLDRDLSKPGPADQPAGAFLMIRLDVWEKLGGFDESFQPIWFEDVDFCRRAASAGYQPYFVPEVTAVHIGGHSIGKLAEGPKQRYWYDSLVRYAAKHFGPIPARFLCIVGAIGVVPRAMIGAIQQQSLHPIANGWRNLKFLGRCLVSLPTHGSR